MKQDLDSFYLSKDEPNKSCLLALRSIILKHDEGFSETTKYGMPCFCYGKKICCYLWTDKKTGEPYILFADGKRMKHPSLESGSRAKMKIFRVNPTIDLAIESINEILDLALSFHKS
jgi:hypothetical protein